MRVLYLIQSMTGGGAERQLAYLCRELVRKGYDVHVAMLYGGPNLERLERSGATIHWIKCRNNYDPLLFARIIRLIRNLHPDITQTWLTQMDVLGGGAALLLGKPYILSEVCNAQAYSTGWKDRLRLLMGKRSDFITSISEGGRDYWLSHGKEPNRVQVIGNAIPFNEVEEFNAAYIGAGPLPEEETIVFAGRYEAQKNLLVLMEAFKIVLDARPAAKVILIGKGSMRDDLIAYRQQHGLTDRMTIGDYTNQLWSVIKPASVFVNASIFEGVPNTVLEAAVLGCPMVLSDIPAHREFFDETSACFVPADSPEAIAAGIIESLDLREAAKGRAEIARQKIAHLSPDVIAEQYHELYKKIIPVQKAAQ